MHRVTKEKKSENKEVKAENSKTTKAKSKKTATSKATKSARASKSKATKSSSKPKSTRKTSSKKSTAKQMLAEYYDLPYGYNETTVKILAQTPTTLFVYWDISEEDRNNLIKLHGENFFNESRPVLIVHNTTKNYSFEVPINDFANSWYIRCQEPNCDYVIELGRKFLEKSEEYVYINSSNDIVSPNDHILFEKSDLRNVLFKNVKTGHVTSKDFGSMRFIKNIGVLYGNVYDIYQKLYKDTQLNEFTAPNSGEFIKKL